MPQGRILQKLGLFQVLKSGPNEPRYKFDEPNPFVSEEEEGEVASVAYRYKKWDLGGGIVSFILFRCKQWSLPKRKKMIFRFCTTMYK